MLPRRTASPLGVPRKSSCKSVSPPERSKRVIIQLCVIYFYSNADHTSTSFKIESRADDGEVRGVYSYIPFPGSSAATTVAYKAGVSGFKVVPLTSIVRLPPLPYSLQAKVPGAAGQNAQARQNFAANPLIYNGGVSWPWRFPVGTSLAQRLTGSDLVDQIICEFIQCCI